MVLKVSLAIACTVSRCGWRRPDRTPKVICEHEARADTVLAIADGGCVCVPAVAGASGGRRVPSLRSRSLCCRVFFTISARVGASVPRPHAASAAAGRAGPRGQGPLPAAGGPVPGPDGSLGDDGGGSGYPFERPRGPGPVKGQKNQLQLQPGLGVITSHPGIVAPAAGVRQGSRAAATRTVPPGGATAPVPGPGRIRASARRSSAQAASAGRAAGPASPPPRAKYRTQDSSPDLVIPSGTSSGSAQ